MIRITVLIGIAFSGWLACSLPAAGAPASTSDDLFQAARAGDAAAVRDLLKNGANIKARDELGNTPLMVAAFCAPADVLELLLKAGAEVNATNKAGATALMRAATFEDKTRLLVAHHADVKARSALGNTALILAARKAGSVRTVKLLLDHGADVNATNIYGASALMAAVAAPDRETVRLLLDRGADVNAKPRMDVDGFIWGGGRTPLMWAAFQGNEALIRLLIERGAKVNEFAVVGSALTQAGWGGYAGAARLLLDAGAQVDHRDLLANYTPLHWAAASEHASPALTELLLARGADPNAEGGQPVDNFLGATQTPLDLARKRGNTPIVQALLKAGARNGGPAVAQRRKPVGQATGTSGARTVADAIQWALSPLTRTAEDSASTFVRHASKQECISCHQQQLPMAAISLAKSRRFTTDAEAGRRGLERLKKMISDPEPGLQTTFNPEPAIFGGYASMDLRLERQSASGSTESIVHGLATIQHPDGHWSWNLPRPPIQASDIGATALAVETLKSFGIPGRRRELESRIERARVWLAKATAESNEERVHQLLGLAWAGEKSGTLRKLARQLAHEQRSDSGWSQLAGLESDAYATGQALYALMEGAGTSSGDPAVRRGIDFLLRTQLPDGTWHVRRRAFPFQPPMESSFGHGADGWISCAGTSWAVMALATSLDPLQVPASTPAPASVTVSRKEAEGTSKRDETPAKDQASVSIDFARDIQPLLERSCIVCHSGERAKGGFQVINRKALLQGGNRGEPAVVAGRSSHSALLRLVSDQVEDLEMPPLNKREKFPALTKDEIARLSTWVDQGAVWPDGVTLHPPAK
jgi:ankyrin repeat protein/mono/diheme cytochrome c family protein